MSALFTPLTLRHLTLPNRIVVSPMCQYSAQDGLPGDWHMIHLGNLALGGPGLVIVEATAVAPEGRISLGCTGIWSDAQAEAFKRILAGIRRWSDTPVGIQLAHAGRKASCVPPWAGGAQLGLDEGGWETVAPSALGFREGDRLPRELTESEIEGVVADFRDAARRADAAGFDVVEIHAAHGYLLHEFLSPLSNRRADSFGGDLLGRMRLPLQVVAAVREVWPEPKPLFVRISASDWVEGGWTIDDSVTFATALKRLGVDVVDCSSAGNLPGVKLPVGPGFQVPFAEQVRREADIPTMAVGLITEPAQAEAILSSGQASLVALARAFLTEPRWVWRAARELDGTLAVPAQWLRGASPTAVPMSGRS